MPWMTVNLTPGLNVELTPTANRSGYSASNLIRFKNGEAQKIGGWGRFYPSNLDGSPRATHARQDLLGNDHLVVGGTESLVDITNGSISDITPQRLTSDFTPDFSTTAGSSIVTISDPNVTAITEYDCVFFATPISVDGILLFGTKQVYKYIASGVYQIDAGSNGLAGVTNGGNVPSFTTHSGKPTVDVTFDNHGLSAGDDFVFPIPTTVSGVTISGRYSVLSVTSPSVFVISASSTASANTGPTYMNSGNAEIVYDISLGPTSSIGIGYGIGEYSAGEYGFGATVTEQTGTNITATDYTLDNWGELSMACPEGGGIYYWSYGSGFTNSSLISTAPRENNGIFVSIAQQMIIAYGSSDLATIGSYHDPLSVKWCDSEDFTTWIGTSTNQAGGYRISTGSKCVGGAATPYRNLIWTDLDLWAMDYIGSTLVFSFNKIGSNCGLIAKHAHAQLAGAVYWMTDAGFFSLNGESVTQMPCPVWDAVFQDLDLTNKDRCFAGSNTMFSEIWFFYPSKNGGGTCDRYAKINVMEGSWDIGNLQRNTWLDKSVVGLPISTTDAGIIYSHETGNDADTSPMNPSFTTGWMMIGDGEAISFIDRIFPDFKWGEYSGAQTSSIMITVYVVNYPGETPRTYGPYTVTQASRFVSKKCRGRQVMLKVESNDLGRFWRLGSVRLRYAPDGTGV
jgi:hypothetical protein